MKAFKELEAHGLHWVQTNGWASLKPTYELRDVNEVVFATLRRTTWWNSSAEVDAPGNRWTFQRHGLFKRYIEIKALGTGDFPARFDYGGWGNKGTLTMRDGTVFHWRQGNFWGNKWGWVDAEGEPFIAFDAKGAFKARAQVRFDDDADFPSLLLFLGWYLYTLYVQDRQSGAVAAT